jgi:hypothetical protein
VAEAYARGSTWRRLLGEGRGLVPPDVRDRMLQLVAVSRSIVSGLDLQLDLQFEAPAVGNDSDRDVAFCFGKVGMESIRCAISHEALEDPFGAEGLDQAGRLRPFREHSSTIERSPGSNTRAGGSRSGGA